MEDGLKKLVDMVEAAELATQDSRALSEKCRDYYDNNQWTEEERKALAARKQPVITYNRIKPKIDFLSGLERQSRQDPKAFPRTPMHQEAADACTDAIRYVADNTNFSDIASTCYKELMLEGTEGCEVIVKPKGKEIEIHVKRFAWDRIIYDPHSRELDFSDAKYLGGVIWMDVSDAKDMFPGHDDMLSFQEDIAGGTGSNTYDDKPTFWVDSKRNRVKIVCLYYRDGGKWHYGWFTKSGFLKGPKLSPYIDENGEPECPLIFQSAHIDREGNRYGIAVPWLDIQDEINHRRSKALHMVNSRQTFSSREAAGENVAKIKREMGKPDGHVEFEYGEWGKDFGIIPTSDMASAQFQLMSESKNEIDAIGVNAALSGSEDRNMSGKALAQRQQGGLVELTPITDAHRHWRLRVYRQIWNRIRQFWDSERWIRVTDDESNLKWVGLNVPITMRQQMEQQGMQIPQGYQDARLDMQVGTQNNIAELDVDIIIDESPDVVTLQVETFQQLSQLYTTRPDLPIDVLIEAMPIRSATKKRLMESLQGGSEAARQQAAQKQAEMAREDAKAQAEIRKENAQAAKYETDAMETMAGILPEPPLIQ